MRMSTVSVPLPIELEERLDTLLAEGLGESRAGIMRRALEHFAEEAAVNAVLRAEREVENGKVLRGSARAALLDA